jgi:ketosteroid isomerase-like protein
MWEKATNRFINGDPSLWKQICSKSNDATIMGGFGGYEKSWDQVGPRYDWAASQFKESDAKLSVEYISTVVSGDLAYILVIERSVIQTVNAEQKTQQALRCTQIFRKENGQWKLLHRHADPLMQK